MKDDANEVPSRKAAVNEKSFMMFRGRLKQFRAGEWQIAWVVGIIQEVVTTRL